MSDVLIDRPELAGLGQYEFGWADSDAAGSVARRGLSDQVVRDISALKREKARWDDPAYVEAQARARFAFGFPGEIGYQVLDDDGSPLDAGSTLDAPPAEVGDGRPEWWESTLSSLDAAERPPQDPRRSSAPIKAAPGDALRGDGDD